MASKSKKAVPEEKPIEPLMYVGPTLTKLGVVQNVVYVEIPETARNAIKDVPIIGTLFIPIAQYPEAERQIRTHEGVYWSAWNAALEL